MEVRSCLQQQRYMLQQREEDLVAKVHRLRDAKEKVSSVKKKRDVV
jgi:hypothetical protein